MDLPKDKNLVSISEAASILGVSIDTIRRWDKAGTLHSQRPDGKNRYFSIEELEKVKFSQPFTISEAAKYLGISQSTLRRIEKKGLITPERNANGERVYNRESIETFLKSEYFLRQKEVQEKILEPLKEPEIKRQEPEVLSSNQPINQATEAVPDQAGNIKPQPEKTSYKILGAEQEHIRQEVSGIIKTRTRAVQTILGGVTLTIFLVSLITIFYLVYPYQTARFFGHSVNGISFLKSKPSLVSSKVLGVETGPKNVLGIALQPFSNLSLKVVKQVSPKTYREIIPETPASQLSEVLSIDSEGNIVLRRNLKLSDTQALIIDDKPSDDVFLLAGSSNVNFSTPSSYLTGGLFLTNNSVSTANIIDGAVTAVKIAVGTITGSNIASGTITTANLASALSFSNGSLIDLSAVNHSSTSNQGLLLPNVSSPDNPGSGKGYLAFNTSSNQVVVYNGSSWSTVSSGNPGTITGVTAGNGLTGGGTSGSVTVSALLPTSGTSSNTSSNSGLEVDTTGLALLRGCTDSQILSWNATDSLWQCSDQTGGGGGGISIIKEGGTNVVTSATSINFGSSDFTVTNSGGGMGTIAIDYTNSKITRSDQTQSITGAWTIASPTITGSLTGSSSPTLSGFGTINGATLSGGSLSGGTISGGTLSGTALSGTGSFTLTGGTGSGDTLTLISSSNSTKGDIQFFSSSNKITSSGALTVAGAITAPTSSNTINGIVINSGTITGATLSAASNTISNLTTSNFTSANISQWTNDSGYITGNQTVTLSGDVSGSGTTSISTSIGNSKITSAMIVNGTITGDDLASDIAITTTGAISSGALTVTSSGTSTLAVGRQGATSPALQVDASTASSVTGLKVKAGAAGGGLALSTVGGNTNEVLTIDAKGSGAITLANSSTGDIQFYSSSNKITSAGALTIAGALISSNIASGATVSGANTGDQTNITGNAGTATALQTARNINGVSFDGTADITVTAAAGTLTGTTLASGVTASSLTSVGTLGSLTVSGAISGATSSNTINGLVINSGALSSITGYTQSSGNFAMSGTGTFGTGTGAVSLNGVTTVAANKLFVVTGGSGDPTTTNGGIWYDTGTDQFKVVEGGAVKVLCNKTDAGCGAGSGSALSAISAAAGANSINNGNNAQVWNWSLTTAAKTAFTFGENSASTNGAGSQYILGVQTASGSTAKPFVATAGGTADGVEITTAGLLQAIGSGGIKATDIVAGTYSIDISGNADTATALETARTINGVSFDGTANITVTAAAGTLTGTTLNSSVVTSSLTSVGTLAGLTVSGTTSINDSASTNTTSIGGGTTTGQITIGGSGTQTLAIGNGAGVKTVNLGSNNSTSTTTILAGSGGLKLNVDNNQPTNINTGSSTGTVTIGGTAGNTINIASDDTTADTIALGSAKDSLSISSTAFKVSSAGAITGVTTITTSGAINKVTLTAPASGSTLTIADGKTLTASNTITLAAGADSKTLNIGSNSLTFSTSADTTVTLPTSGTLVNSGVSTLSSLTTVGSLVSGTVIATQTFTNNNIADSGALTIKSASNNALTLDSGTTGAVNLGTGNNAKTIAIGTGTAGNTINIGTNDTTKDTINLGSLKDDVVITAANWSVDATGALTVASCTGCGGGSQTPWTSDIDADNNSLLDLGSNITSRAGLTVGSADNGSGASGAVILNTGTGTTSTGALTLVSGNASAGTAGNISMDVGTSTSSNGSILIGTAARTQTITIGNSTGGTITIGASSGSNLVLNDAQWSVTGAGAATFASVDTGSGSIVTTGTIGSAGNTAFTGNTGTFSGAIAANGGITFNDASDTLGAFTLAGTVNANTNLITNIGDAGTDFVAGGGLTLAGAFTANGAVDINTSTIDIATQATDLEIKDNTASAFTISQSTNNYFLITTTNDAEVVTLDLPAGGVSSLTGNLFTSNIAKTINLGTGTAADTIHIGEGGTNANTITIGSDAVANTITIGSSSSTGVSITDNNWSITTGGVATFITGSVIGSQTFTTNNIADSGALTIKSATGANALTLDSGSTGNVNLGTSNNAKTINIGTGTAGNTLHIADDDTTADTITLGSAKDSFTLASTGLDVSSAGALSGITTITTSGAINKVTITAPTSSATLTIADGKTLTYNNSITISGTDSTTMTMPSSSTTLAGLSIANAFTAAQGITVSSATALTVANTGTNYGFQVDTSTGSSATGLKIKSAAAAGGLAVSVISSGTDEALTLDAKGAGAVTIAGTSTGNLNLGTSSTAKTIQIGNSGSAADTILIGNSSDTAVKIAKFATANGLLYISATDGTVAQVGAGSTNQCLIGTTGSAPTWGACSGSATVNLNNVAAANAAQTGISNGDNDIVWNWAPSTASTTPFTFGFTAAPASGTNNGVKLSFTHTSNTMTSGLLIDENGTGGTLTNGIQITKTNGTMTTGISIGSGSQAITTGIDIASTGVTTDLDLQNGESIDNDSNGTITLKSDSGALTTTLSSNSGTSILNSGGALTINSASTNALTLDSASAGGVINIGTSGSTTHVALFNNNSAPAAFTGTAGIIKLGALSTTATSGRIWISGGSTITNYTFKSAASGLSDYSEFMSQSPTEGSEPGDLMVMTKNGTGFVARGQRVYDSQIVGAVTTNVRGTSNNDLDYNDYDGTGSRNGNPNWANVGMVGQVYVKVSLENGPIQAGDPITTSSAKGFGMKASKSGRVVGFAEQSWTGVEKRDAAAPQQALPSGVGMILVYIHPTWFDVGDQSLNIADVNLNGVLSYPSSSIDNFIASSFNLTDKSGHKVDNQVVSSEALIANLNSGSIRTQELTAKVSITEDLFTQGLTVLGDDGLAKIKFKSNGDAFFAGTITADKIKANQIEGLSLILSDMLGNSVQYIASSSAALTNNISPTSNELTSLNVAGLATVSGKLTTDTLHVKDSALVESVLSVVDMLTSARLIVSDAASFLGNVVFKKDVTFEGRPTFNQDTAGVATIKQGDHQVVVNFIKEYTNSPVVNISISLDKGVDQTTQDNLEQAILNGDIKYIVTEKTNKGFIIKLNKSAPADLTFSWTSLATTGRTSSSNLNSVPSASPTPSPSATIEATTSSFTEASSSGLTQ
jgi:DNA-binding transcriptional MerR regulator